MREIQIPLAPAPEATRDRRLARLATVDPRPEFLSLGPEAIEPTLKAWLAERGEPAYRANQIVRAVYRRRVPGWSAITSRIRLDWRALARQSLTVDQLRTPHQPIRMKSWIRSRY